MKGRMWLLRSRSPNVYRKKQMRHVLLRARNVIPVKRMHMHITPKMYICKANAVDVGKAAAAPGPRQIGSRRSPIDSSATVMRYLSFKLSNQSEHTFNILMHARESMSVLEYENVRPL